jgi:hypothetical protein
MDLSRSQLMKAAPVGPIAAGTGGLPPANSLSERLAGLIAPARPVLTLAQQLTPTAHDPFRPLAARPREHLRQLGRSHCPPEERSRPSATRRVMT